MPLFSISDPLIYRSSSTQIIPQPFEAMDSSPPTSASPETDISDPDTPPDAGWDKIEPDVQLDYDYKSLTDEERQLIQDAMNGVDILAKNYVVCVPQNERSDTARSQKAKSDGKGNDDMDGVEYGTDEAQQECEEGIKRMQIKDEGQTGK
ncbi:MAG: hypothetical protein Q9213_003695 [Squamulea squamosa]